MHVALAVKIGAGVVAGGLAVGAAYVLVADPTPALAGVPQAWIDDPLPGTVVVGGPIEVVAHATDPHGVDEVELRVDGEEVATEDASGDRIVEMQLSWEPPGNGSFELAVRGRSSSGWGAPGTVTVRVAAAEVAPPTSTPGTTLVPGQPAPSSTSSTGTSSTTTPGATAPGGAPSPTTTPGATVPRTSPTPTTTTPPRTTPTTNPCANVAPTPAAPANGSSVVNTPRLSWTFPSCPVDVFLVQVSRDPAFARFEVNASVSSSARSYTTPALASCTTFYWRVAAVRTRVNHFSPTWSFGTFLGRC
jgi:hypothetical protein